MTRPATTRVVGLVALGGVAALGGIAALGMASFGAGAVTGTSKFSEADKASHTTTAVATSVLFTVDLQADLPAQSTVHLLVQGQMNFVHHTLAAVVTVPNVGSRSSASNTELIPVGGSMKLHTQWVDDRAYMTVPTSWSALAKGAQTLSLPASPSMHRKIDTALAQSAVALTYARILLNELTVHQAVRPLGSRTIDGVSATGTKVDLTLSQLLKLVPELSPTMTRYTTTMANETIPVTVWVDPRGRLVEVNMAATRGNAASVTGTVRFSHYDALDKVTAPPANTVKPIPPALWQLLGGLYFF